MEKVLAEQPEAPRVSNPASVREILQEREREDRDFGQLEREARERAAEQRLEELKRRMK
jgi:hypothetical protein